MYLLLSLSKLNFFVSLIGLVLLCTNAKAEGSLCLLQGLILGFALLHFIILVSSHLKQTRCAKSLAWRFTLILCTIFKLAIVSLAMYVSISDDDDSPGWYLDVSFGMTIVFLLYEVQRTCVFARR